MDFNDEQDYIMRIIKEMVRVLFSLILGKQYESVELPDENKYEVSGKALEEFEKMVDRGLVNMVIILGMTIPRVWHLCFLPLTERT